LLPLIVGGSAINKTNHKYTPFIITASLVISIFVFSLTLRTGSEFLGLSEIPQSIWAKISGGLVALLGLVLLFPQIWDQVSAKTGFQASSNKLMAKSSNHKGVVSSILTGAALGPVFTSCSPTYAFILFSILPRSYFEGSVLLVAYCLGLAIMLLSIAILGKHFVDRIKWAANPEGNFRRGVGILFILIGLAVWTGLDKVLEEYLLGIGVYEPLAQFEIRFLD
jgi:cytochrome c-type biogenesis protein